MDKFPSDFNRSTCYDKMIKKQHDLIKNVRMQFYEELMKNVDSCEQKVTLTFPDNLWNEHRITIISEILDGFGKIKLITINPQHTVVKLINSNTIIPSNVKKIEIDFIKNE